ncbi:Hypothetical predicted protein, partial [Pelobates cultripes]
MEVKSLYTVIPHGEGVEAMRTVLSHSSVNKGLPIEFVLEVMTLALEHNYFRFEKEWFLQVSGTSIGAAMAPMYANAYMYVYEKNNILIPYAHLIQGYYRFIDDLLIIWKGTSAEAYTMVEDLNRLQTPIRLKANISPDKVQYLDVKLSIGKNNIEYCLYTKAMDRNTLLHAQSAHPESLKKSLPKAQYLGVIRNNLNDIVKEMQLQEMTNKFLNRGYHSHTLSKALEDAKTTRARREASSIQRLVFPMTFHNLTPQISATVRKNWRILATDDTLPKVFHETPLICHKRNKSLKDML